MGTGAVMILFNEKGQVLMEERDEDTLNYPGYWNLPSGGSEPGERPEETARRELREEAGYEAPSLKLLFTTPQTRPDGQKTLRYVYLVGFDPNQKIRKGSEGKSMEFKNPREFSTMKVFQDHIEFVRKAKEMRRSRCPESGR